MEHPQTNGQAEATHKVILQGLKKKMGAAKAKWVDILPEVVWSYHTTVQSTTKETPFDLVYGGDAILSIEVEMMSRSVENFSEATSDEGRLYRLDTIDELREKARIRESVQKWRIEAKYLSKVHAREFKERDLILRKAGEANMDSKLASRWIGPYRERSIQVGDLRWWGNHSDMECS